MPKPKRPNKYPASLKQADARRREIQLIKIAQKQLGMDDDGYRALLWRVAQVKSSTELDSVGRKAVLEHMEKCGWKRTGKPQTRALADDPQSQKIRALWLQLHAADKVRNPSEEALAAFVKRQHGVAALQWLSAAQAQKLIEELKKWLAR